MGFLELKTSRIASTWSSSSSVPFSTATMAHPFSSATIPVRPFAISHSESQVADLKTLLRLSPLAPSVFENDDSRQGKYGVSRTWMRSTRDAWLQFDWASYEKKLNAYPHFVASVPDPAIREGYKHDIHFVGVYNKDPKATPLILLHGWPGSFIEFLPLIEHLQDASTPVHIIIPSLPGYTYSSDAPMECEFGFEGIARVMDGLMKGLGFGDGYVVQGGDLGGYVSRVLGAKYDACKAVHLNFSPADKPPSRTPADYKPTPTEEKGLERALDFRQNGYGYFVMHATRPATMGFAIASSPVALMAWIGEKILAWTDPSTTPSTEHIVEWLSLWWLTTTYPRSIYPYRHRAEIPPDISDMYINKPTGYSAFPYEVRPTPKGWVEGGANLVFYREHTQGGHFAAMERPQALAKDILDFLRVALNAGS